MRRFLVLISTRCRVVRRRSTAVPTTPREWLHVLRHKQAARRRTRRCMRSRSMRTRSARSSASTPRTAAPARSTSTSSSISRTSWRSLGRIRTRSVSIARCWRTIRRTTRRSGSRRCRRSSGRVAREAAGARKKGCRNATSPTSSASPFPAGRSAPSVPTRRSSRGTTGGTDGGIAGVYFRDGVLFARGREFAGENGAVDGGG